jgi:hypothetical protein
MYYPFEIPVTSTFSRPFTVAAVRLIRKSTLLAVS